MDVKDKLEQLATSYGWRFVHARRDYQNLTDALAFVTDEIEGYGVGETILFLDPVIRDFTESDGVKYSGNFMILTKSDLDMSYEEKQEKYINPLVEVVQDKLRSNLSCSYKINQFRTIEVINVFDINADGLSIQFNLKG